MRKPKQNGHKVKRRWSKVSDPGLHTFPVRGTKIQTRRNIGAALPRKCFSEVFSLEERIFDGFYCKNPGEAWKQQSKQETEVSWTGRLRKEKSVSENVALAEDADTEPTKAMTIKKLAWRLVDEVWCARAPLRAGGHLGFNFSANFP